MRHHVYPTSPILAPYIRQFAISETAEEQTYRVLPDNGLVMGFQYKGRLSLVQQSTHVDLSFCGLSGLHDTWRLFKNAPDTGTVLVYFKPGAAAHFFRQPLHELFGNSVSLEQFMLYSQIQELEERLSEAVTDDAKIQLVEQLLVARLLPAQPDALVLQALQILNQRQGLIRIKELATIVHASQSSLEKRFRQVVGASPKKYAGILRLKQVIENYNPVLSLTDVSYEAGFYDQAHFITAFKTFTGQTPQQFFKSSDSI
jgi:AraC-like DNA-binding protein